MCVENDGDDIYKNISTRYGARKGEIIRNLNSHIIIRKVEYYNTNS